MTPQPRVSNERGRFVLGPSGHPRFAGSSTGIYLADTVWTAVSPVATDADLDEAFLHRNNRHGTGPSRVQQNDSILAVDAFRNEDQVRQHFCNYFRLWHPLFPFLDGRIVSSKLDEAIDFARNSVDRVSSPQSLINTSAFPNLSPDEALVYSTIFRAIITLGGMAPRVPDVRHGSTNLGSLQDLCTPGQAMHLSHLIVSACQVSRISEILALQGLLAIQVLFFGLRETRTAMHIGGISTKIAFEAGLHRCPNRFLQTFRSIDERDLRKRIFYSLYALDRLLAAEFGIPLTMHDTDIDTCLPGDVEVHHGLLRPSPPHAARLGENSMSSVQGLESVHRSSSARTDNASDSGHLKRKDIEARGKSPLKRARADEMLPTEVHGGSTIEESPSENIETEATQNTRLLPALTLTRMTRMVGMAMETFNKSVAHRANQSDEALTLRVTLDTWWNDIGLDLDEDDPLSDGNNDNPHLQPFSVLFTCLYYQQIINIARPSLSLSPTSVQHALALQSSINSVRTICATLTRSMKQNAEALSWPGYVDMLFFGTLILVYGTRKENNRPSALKLLKRDLGRIHRLLKQFDLRWKHLKPLIKIVEAFLMPLNDSPRNTASLAESSTRLYQTGVTGDSLEPPADTLNALAFRFQGPGVDNFDDPAEGDFFFDFDSFELHPASMWAYRPSIPNSPQ